MKQVWAMLLCLLLFGGAGSVHASQAPIVRDLPPGLHIPEAAQPGPGFDVDRATAAYLDLLSPEQRQLSNEYFEGAYWLQLWSLLYGLGVSALLLMSGWSQRIRAFAQRRTQRAWLQSGLYAVAFLLLSFLLGFPFSFFTDFVREHQYHLSEQSLNGWLGDQLKGLLVMVILGTVALVVLYAAVRRAGDRWWVWASGLSFVFLLFLLMVEPVFIAPLFNDYKPLPEGPLRESVLSLARANGIPTAHLDWFDASKQTTRISANVSGLWGTTRINLNDNLISKTSPQEIRAVLGHEMGHYVLNHGLRLTVYLSLVLAFSFWLVHRAMDRALQCHGTRLGLGGRDDPAALPLAIAFFSIVSFVMTPLFNSITRQAEAEADAFGLDAAREPQGFAMAAMRLSTYRKIRPGPIEEILFYDHPSGYERVHAAMVWQKENLPTGPAAAPVSP